MKGWFKKITVGPYELLVQRLCNNSSGEHISITIRVTEGQMITTMSFEDDEKACIKAFKEYGKKQSKEFIASFEKMYNNEKESDKEKS